MLAQLINDYGIANADAIVRALEQPDRPLPARALAMLENESAGRNIFGAEGTACPAEWWEQEVTHTRYQIYARRRDAGLTNDGVGPTQLTDTILQQEADHRGGCWIPLHNLEVGFQLLHELITKAGEWDGFRAYNGTGPAADAYATRAIERTAIWQARLHAHHIDW